MKTELRVSTEVNTIIEVDIPINPNGRTKGQISNWIDENWENIAELAKENLKRNFESDWMENVFIKVEE